MDAVYTDVASITAWVARRGCARVALQFPDALLDVAVATTRELQAACPGASFYVLADTTFGSCCVDEVAASHVDAQCVVHFGRSCLSRVSRLPTLLVFPQLPLDVSHCAAALLERCPTVVVVDQEYTHALDSLRTQTMLQLQQCSPPPEVVFIEAPQRDMEPQPVHEAASPPETDAQVALGGASTRSARVLCGIWELPEHVTPAECSLVWVGSSSPVLLRTLMSLPSNSDGSSIPCAQYEPVTRCWSPSACQKEDAARLLKRRYYLVERAKDASIVGIIAGTLSVAGARHALDRVRRLAEAAGKKTYTFLVGKPNPAKLGNFPEVGVFVMVACPETALLDSRDFLAPVITSFEAELAFAPGAQWQAGVYSTSLDARPRVAADSGPDVVEDEGDFSLVTGKLRGSTHRGGHAAQAGAADRVIQVIGAHELAAKPGAGALAEVTTAAQFLSVRRTYQGLVPVAPECGDAPLLAAAGQSGRAASYAGEGKV